MTRHPSRVVILGGGFAGMYTAMHLERRWPKGTPLEPFRFSGLRQLAAIGRRRGVAQILGFRFSGFFAWLLWRAIYLSKLPRFERKVRIALDWTLDLVFSKDIVQFQTYRGVALSRAEPAATPLGAPAGVRQ